MIREALKGLVRDRAWKKYQAQLRLARATAGQTRHVAIRCSPGGVWSARARGGKEELHARSAEQLCKAMRTAAAEARAAARLSSCPELRRLQLEVGPDQCCLCERALKQTPKKKARIVCSSADCRTEEQRIRGRWAYEQKRTHKQHKQTLGELAAVVEQLGAQIDLLEQLAAG